MERMYLRLIALVVGGDQVKFKRDDNQRDEQELATDVIRQLREKMAQKRAIWNARERSSSLEPDEAETEIGTHIPLGYQQELYESMPRRMGELL
ncbi:hypothetical protein BGX24_004900 [Mortierella sp. AD032]|nr:hypothetical protein BGX24_004900 [Mortierella sp. AD032]